MRVLVFDTSFSACSAALIDTGPTTPDDARAQPNATATVLASCNELMHTGQATRLLPMIGEVLAQAGQTFDDLDAIATANGPGTFTGVRIAVATARALALSTRLPILGFSSLALVAAKASASTNAAEKTRPDSPVIAATMDARRDEIYVQLFTHKNGPPLTKPQILAPADAARLTREHVTVVGTGALAYQDAAIALGHSAAAQLVDLQPDATFSSGVHMEPIDPFKPLYLRPPDAKPQAAKIIPRVQQ